jgi:PRTRC genetic system protein A
MDIITQFISCVVTPNELPAAMEAGYNEIYVMTGSKESPILKHHKLRGQNRYVRLAVDKLPDNYKTTRISQEINFLPDGKIPIELFDQVVAFFKQVMEVKKSEVEAMIWICWDAESGYHLIVPDQRVSKASASYDWSSLPTGKTIVCDIHSHNTMGAFFSGTDNRDDQNNIGFSGVVGHLKSTNPQTVWRFNYRDKKIECELDDVFELPARPEAAVPADWVAKINTYTPPVTVYGGNSTKGKAEHLKPWQYKKGDAGSGEKEGNRAGPHLQNQRGLLPGESWDGRDIDWQGDFWGMAQNPALSHPDDAWNLTPNGEDERLAYAERALARAFEDPSYDESHLPPAYTGNAGYNPAFDPDVDQATGEIRNQTYQDGPGMSMYAGDDRYDEVHAQHGHDTAEAFCLIDDIMANLSGKDELVETIMADMLHMASDGPAMETLFKRLYQELPDEVQERIQMNGIH